MGDKKLTVSLEGTVSPSIQRMTKALESVQSNAVKASKALQSAAGTGDAGAGKAGGLAKALLAEKKLFDDLGKSGEKLAKILNEQVAKSQGTLTKQLEASTKGLDLLVKKHEFAASRVSRLTREGADPSRIALAQSYASRAGTAVMGGAVGKLQAQAALAALGGGAGGPGGGGAGGGVSGGVAGGRGGALQRILGMGVGMAGVPMGGMLMGLGPAGLIAGAVAATILGGIKIASAAQQGAIPYEAQAGAMQSTQFGMTSSLNARWMLGKSALAADPTALADIESGRGFLAKTKASLFAAPTLLSGYGAFSRAASLASKTAHQEMVNERIVELGEAKGIVGDAFERQKAQRAQINAIGWRHGARAYNFANTVQAATGVEADQVRGFYGGLAPMAGAWGAPRYASMVAGATASGMDPGQALNIIGRGAGTGSNLLRPTVGFDPTIRGIAGEYAAGTLAAGSTLYAGKGEALAGILAGSVTAGGGAGVMQAQQAAGGAGLYGKLFGGHEPFQKSFNIAAASAALGPGSDPYQRQFLADVMKDPAILSTVLKATDDSQLPPQLRSMGVSLSAAKAFARDVDRGSAATRIQDFGGDYPAAKLMREMGASGGKMAWVASMRKRGVSEAEISGKIRDVSPRLAQVERGLTAGEAGAGEELLRFGAGATRRPAARAGARAGAGAAAEDAPWVISAKASGKLGEIVDDVNLKMAKLGGGVNSLTTEIIDSAKLLNKEAWKAKWGVPAQLPVGPNN